MAYVLDPVGSYPDSLGLFGPRSESWKIHADPVSLVGGVRALLLQALSRRSMQAVLDSSAFGLDPWGRLSRTSDFVMLTTFGTRLAAENAIANVRAIHAGISGSVPGSELRYSAQDPELLAFVHNCFVDSILVTYEKFSHPLSLVQQNRYLREQSEIARKLGADMSHVVLDRHELVPSIETSSDLGMSDGAAKVFIELSSIKFPNGLTFLGPLWSLIFGAAVDELPGFAKDMYAIPAFRPFTDLRRKSIQTLMQAVRLSLPGHPYFRNAKQNWYHISQQSA